MRFDFLRVTFICLILAFALGGSGHSVSAAGTSTVSVSAPAQIVSPGSQFTVNIDVQLYNSIAGAQFSLSFNPSLVSVTSITEGNLLKQNGSNTYFSPGQINNATGTVTGVAGAIVTPGQTVSGTGTLAVITMTAGSNKGTSTISLSNVVVGDINGQSVPISMINGQTSVDQAPVLSAIGNKTVNVGSLLTFTISATDLDGDSLTYSASNLPTGSSFNTSTRKFSWTPALGQVGVYSNIHFEATDGMITIYENIMITVTKATPIFSNLPAPTINFGTAATSLNGTIKSGSLCPTGSVSITLNGVTHSAVIDGTGNFSSSFAISSLGTAGSPYTISYVYSGDNNFNNVSDNTKTLTVVPIFLAWDVNMDGAVNVLDMISISQQWGSSGSAGWIKQDMNSDGIINVLDFILIGQHWTG